MSINHCSSDLPEALWWAQHHRQLLHLKMEPSSKSPSSKHNNFNIPNTTTATTFWTNSQGLYHHPMSCTQNSALSFDLNNEDDEEIEEQLTDERENVVKEEPEVHYQQQEIPKQPLFEKPLTPSDVGKLNRLVIPKQHAEKCFPLNGNDSGEKGLLLSFEDELGKPWRFRYSYWNSSQSYVLTKGWSRFVKEKRLDAGDIVLFERHRLDVDRLFIGWKRRSAAANPGPDRSGVAHAQALAMVADGGGGDVGWTRLLYSGNPYLEQPHGHGPALPYQPNCLHAGNISARVMVAASVLQSQTTPSANANSKRLRLFGVNLDLECQPDDSEPATPEDGSSASNQGQAQCQCQYYTNPKLDDYNHHDHMDINFKRDVNQTKYRQG